jgi:hypothetical protein
MQQAPTAVNAHIVCLYVQAGKNIQGAAEDAKDAVGDAYDSTKKAAR